MLFVFVMFRSLSTWQKAYKREVWNQLFPISAELINSSNAWNFSGKSPVNENLFSQFMKFENVMFAFVPMPSKARLLITFQHQ